MQVPVEIRNSVAFIACYRNGALDIRATAFFVHHPIEGSDMGMKYIVTAKHVIEKIRQIAPGEDTYIRLNTSAGGSLTAIINDSEWRFSDDDRIDVAVAAIALKADEIEHLCIPTDSFLTSENVHDYEIGLGEEIFFPGLFSQHKGEFRNIPIVRTGTIAAMPEERIKTKWGNLKAYLLEARSIGGLSGSPAFIYLSSIREQGGFIRARSGEPRFLLLGMIHGHFGIDDDLLDVDEPESDSMLVTKKSINMGIAIAIPSSDILSVINSDILIADRKRQLQDWQDRNQN